MTSRSQRRAFTCLMALLAPAFAVGVMGGKYARQADIVSDTIKIGVLLALCTAIVSVVIWTCMSSRFAPFKTRPLLRGAIAGCLTALIIIPLPAFGWSLKTELISAHQSGQLGLGTILMSFFTAIKWGFLTFVDITKASLIAVIGSSAVGAAVTHYVPAKRGETTLGSNAHKA